MIKNNTEHQKAKLKKIIGIGKMALIISLMGNMVTLPVFVYSNFIKEYDVTISDVSIGSYSTDVTVGGMIVGGLEEEYKKEIEDAYMRLQQKENENNNTNVSVELVYDETKSDSDVVYVSDKDRDIILSSLDRRDDIDNPNIQITVGDLKQIRNLTGFNKIEVFADTDISWLNYCENLSDIEISLVKGGVENLKQIKNLNVKKLDIDLCWAGNLFRIDLNEENFPFLKNNNNLQILSVNANIINVNTPLVAELGKNSENSCLFLYDYRGDSQKLDVENFENWSKVLFQMEFGKGTYDFASLYTNEEVNQLINSDFEFGVYDSDGNKMDKTDFFKEVSEIHKQIDSIVESLDIKEKMSDDKKINRVLEYTLTNLIYSDTSKEIQKNEGVEEDIFGNQSESLVDDLLENSYKDGYLYGALNENGKPVCGSYAALVEVLLRKVGVEAYHVNSKYHAYNLVNVDGEYYYVDATFLDEKFVDIDEALKGDQYLIDTTFVHDIYKTNIIPENVVLSEVSVEEKVQKLIDDTKREYLIKFNNQVLSVSFTVFMTILSVLGIAIPKRKLENLNSKFKFSRMRYDEIDSLRDFSDYVNSEVRYSDKGGRKK